MGDYFGKKITSSLDRDQQSHEKGNQLGEVKHSEMLAEFGLIGCDGGRSAPHKNFPFYCYIANRKEVNHH